MSSRGFVEVEGVIVAGLAQSVFRVELANGHRLVGRVPAHERWQRLPLAAGDRVTVRVSPADFSAGRITRAGQLS